MAASAARTSLSGRSARESGFFAQAPTSAAVPRRIPACGPPSVLSPEKQTRSAPSASASAGTGSSREARLFEALGSARAGVVEERDARLPAEGRERAEGDLLGEPDDPVVRRSHLQDRHGPGADRLGVVVGRRLVRRPDLQEGGAASREDRRDAEVAPDRDELAPRDGDGPAVGERVEGEEKRGGGVRDGQGVEVLSAGGEKLEEERPHVLTAGPAPSGREVELQRRVAARRGGRPPARRRRAAPARDSCGGGPPWR